MYRDEYLIYENSIREILNRELPEGGKPGTYEKATILYDVMSMDEDAEMLFKLFDSRRADEDL